VVLSCHTVQCQQVKEVPRIAPRIGDLFSLRPPSERDVARAWDGFRGAAGSAEIAPSRDHSAEETEVTTDSGRGAAGVFPGILVDEAVLPGEDHFVHGNWDQEAAALAELPEGGGE